MQYRELISHEQYLTQQAASGERAAAAAQLRTARDHKIFKLKFRRIQDFIRSPAVCLGAGFGTEVGTLRGFGHADAVGLDIGAVPGSDDLVRYGDFMRLTDPDEAYGFAYTNSYHCTKDPQAFIGGLARVMKPGAFAQIDVMADADADPDWSAFAHWRPDGLAEIASLLEQEGVAILADWEIRKPFRGRAYLLKFKAPITSEDTQAIEAALADVPEEDRAIRAAERGGNRFGRKRSDRKRSSRRGFASTFSRALNN